MTLATTTDRITYGGNGATTVFAYAFTIPDAASVVVTVLDSLGNVTVVNAAQYSITNLGVAGGGNVTYPVAGSGLPNLPAGSTILIQRITSPVQSTSIPNQSSFYGNVIEAAFDRLMMIVQELQATYQRAVQYNAADPTGAAAMPVAALRANKAAVFDANGNLTAGGQTLTAVSAAMIPVVQAATLTAAVAALFPGLGKMANVVCLIGTASLNFPSTGAGRTQTLTMNVAGAAVGDLVLACDADGNINTLGGFLKATITGANTINVMHINVTAGAIAPAVQNVRVVVVPKAQLGF